jgi:hypothetical protein
MVCGLLVEDAYRSCFFTGVYDRMYRLDVPVRRRSPAAGAF